MPIYQPEIYRRADARRNPDALFVFGDNALRKGFGGQADEMRGEPNAVGVRTKYLPSMNPDAFFREDPACILAQNRMIDEDMKRLFMHLRKGGLVVWPAAGIGTGYSALPTCAPTTYEYLMKKFAAMWQTAKLFEKGDNARLLQMREQHE